MSGAKLTVQTTVVLEPTHLARAFCDLTDEGQAQVIIEIAKIIDNEWPGGVDCNGQMRMVGRHLRDCSCSNESARSVIREIMSGIEP
jgi:hypothetical protein